MSGTFDNIIRRAMADTPPVADISEEPVSTGSSYGDIIQKELLKAGALKSDNKQLDPPQDLSINLPYYPNVWQADPKIPWMRDMHNMRPSENVIDRRNDTLADRVMRDIYYTFRGTHAGGGL